MLISGALAAPLLPQAPAPKPQKSKPQPKQSDESGKDDAPADEKRAYAAPAEESSEDEGPQFNLKEYEALKAEQRAALPTLTKAPARKVTADDGLQVVAKGDDEEALYGMGQGGKSKKGKNKNQRGAANVDDRCPQFEDR